MTAVVLALGMLGFLFVMLLLCSAADHAAQPITPPTPLPMGKEPVTENEKEAAAISWQLAVELCNGWGEAHGVECRNRIHEVMLEVLNRVRPLNHV